MIKMTQDELARSINIFCRVFDAVAPDLDTLEDFDYTNKACMEMCVDYVYMYAPDPDSDDAFMQELYKRIGYDAVIKQLCKAYSLV